MYHLAFLNPVEVRMGSPFNIAEVSLKGQFVPSFEGTSFQDKGAITSDGKICFLVEWKTISGNRPGFCVWKISEDDASVRKSEIIQGCCEEISLRDQGIELLIFNDGRSDKLQIVDFNNP